MDIKYERNACGFWGFKKDKLKNECEVNIRSWDGGRECILSHT